MNRTFVTGDIHGELGIYRLSSVSWPIGKTLDKNDVLIILGDFGFPWTGDPGENRLLDWLNSKKWTTVFIDGNHENFDLLYQFPQEHRFGGIVGVLKDSIFHLRQRGHIYKINDKSFWCFGGAYSIDKYSRAERVSWWPEEEATTTEMNYGIDSLDNVNWNVDCVLTHDCPLCITKEMINEYGAGGDPIKSVTNRYLDTISEKISAKCWYFGHHHIDYNNFKTKTDRVSKYQALYKSIIEIK